MARGEGGVEDEESERDSHDRSGAPKEQRRGRRKSPRNRKVPEVFEEETDQARQLGGVRAGEDCGGGAEAEASGYHREAIPEGHARGHGKRFYHPGRLPCTASPVEAILLRMVSVASALLVVTLLTGPLVQEGGASYYGREFEGRRTASGERFTNEALTAAHRTHAFGTWVRVTRLDTGDSVIVRINDRGPFVRGRIIDLSRRAAEEIRMVTRGVAHVRVEAIPAPEAELRGILAGVSHLVGDIPAPGETILVGHAILPIGYEGVAVLPTPGGTEETVFVPFRVVTRIPRPPYEMVTEIGGRSRRAVRILPPASVLPAAEPVSLPVSGAVPDVLFPTPVIPQPTPSPLVIDYPGS